MGEERHAFRMLFEALFDFMSMSTEFMTLDEFESAMKRCKISCDRRDVLIICFKELSATNKSFITKNSFVAWIIARIYTVHNNKKRYKNYKQHYDKYYKWIEHDLFVLVSNNDSLKPKTMSKQKSYESVSVANSMSKKRRKRRKKRPQSSRHVNMY